SAPGGDPIRDGRRRFARRSRALDRRLDDARHLWLRLDALVAPRRWSLHRLGARDRARQPRFRPLVLGSCLEPDPVPVLSRRFKTVASFSRSNDLVPDEERGESMRKIVAAAVVALALAALTLAASQPMSPVVSAKPKGA